MAGITLAQAETHLTNWLAASTALALGKSYQIGGRTLTRSDATEVLKMVNFWDGQVKRLTRGGISIRGAIPGDG